MNVAKYVAKPVLNDVDRLRRRIIINRKCLMPTGKNIRLKKSVCTSAFMCVPLTHVAAKRKTKMVFVDSGQESVVRIRGYLLLHVVV